MAVSTSRITIRRLIKTETPVMVSVVSGTRITKEAGTRRTREAGTRRTREAGTIGTKEAGTRRTKEAGTGETEIENKIMDQGRKTMEEGRMSTTKEKTTEINLIGKIPSL